MSLNRKKRKQDDLASLVESARISENETLFDGRSAQRVLFEHGQTEIVVNDGTKFYSHKKCDYDERLIGSPRYWHQIIVSFDCSSKKYVS